MSEKYMTLVKICSPFFNSLLFIEKCTQHKLLHIVFTSWPKQYFDGAVTNTLWNESKYNKKVDLKHKTPRLIDVKHFCFIIYVWIKLYYTNISNYSVNKSA